MKKLLFLILFASCVQSYDIPTCETPHDYTWFASIGLPSYSTNCANVTNEQIRWLQVNDYFRTLELAPDNKNAATKAEILRYVGTAYLSSKSFEDLAQTSYSPIGYLYPNL